MSHPAFQARSVRKAFGRKVVLDDLNLCVDRGDVLALLGRNGTGKTTFLRAALGMVEIDGGSIEVAGFDARREPIALRRVVGFVPDRPDVYPWMTVVDLMRFLAPHYPNWNRHEATRLIETFDVPTDVPFRGLSRGQATKALLAAALAPMPQVLILDEPFAGLDPVARDELVRGVIGELRAESRTILVATHDLDVAARLADRVAFLGQGRIQRLATMDEITNDDESTAASQALRSAFELATTGAPS